MFDVTLKTAVSTRASLLDRVPSRVNAPTGGGGGGCCSDDNDKSAAAAETMMLQEQQRRLHHYASTYTRDYDAQASRRLTRNAATTTSLAAATTTTTTTTTTAATSTPARTTEQQTQTQPAPSYRVVAQPSSTWQSESHAASRALQPEVCLDFYSNARKIERLDDDRRGGLVGNVQRTVDILRRRAHDDARLRVPAATFVRTERARPSAHAARERGSTNVPFNYLDLVSCTHALPSSEQQRSYDVAPASRLPPAGTLSPSWRVQSKAVTRYSTTRELQRGTVKHLDDAHAYAPGYTGHIPVADRNLAQLHATADVSSDNNNSDNNSSDAARVATGDARRVFAKAHMTLAVHGGGVDASVTGNSIAARHRGGKNARAPQMLKPRSERDLVRTVEGSMLQRTLRDTLPCERAMNTRYDAPHDNDNVTTAATSV